MLKNVTSLSSISRKSQNKIPNMKLTCFSRTGMLTPFIENADFVPNGLHHSEWGQINFHINPFIWCWHWRETKSKYIILNFENTNTNTSSLIKDEKDDDHDGSPDSRTLAEKPIWVSGGNGPEILSPSPRLAWGNNIHAWIFELLTGLINLVSGQSFWLPMMSKLNKTLASQMCSLYIEFRISISIDMTRQDSLKVKSSTRVHL